MGSQVPAGQGTIGFDELSRSALKDHEATVVAGPRAEIHYPVGPRDDIEVVLDNDHGATAIDETVEEAMSLSTSAMCRPVVGSSNTKTSVDSAIRSPACAVGVLLPKAH